MRLSQKIKNLKISCQLESLSQEQTVLQSELREFEMNLRNYESAIGSLNKPTSVVSCNKENKKCHDYKDIDDFHALIAKTGNMYSYLPTRNDKNALQNIMHENLYYVIFYNTLI